MSTEVIEFHDEGLKYIDMVITVDGHKLLPLPARPAANRTLAHRLNKLRGISVELIDKTPEVIRTDRPQDFKYYSTDSQGRTLGCMDRTVLRRRLESWFGDDFNIVMNKPIELDEVKKC